MRHWSIGVAAAALVAAGSAFAIHGAALATPGVLAAHSTSSTSVGERPVVILVHGRGQILGDSAGVRSEWSRVLQSGASRIGSGSLLRDDDIWLAWYADALDPLASIACDTLPASRSAANGEGADDERLRAFFAAAGAGITAALELIDEPLLRLEARALAGDLLFLGDPLRRCAAERRLEDVLARAELQNRPVILVAHSFGSLIAYGYLHSTTLPADSGGSGIQRFVTLGSLLGAPGARQLFLRDREARASLPPGVHAWTNILDVRDGLAHPIAFGGDSTRAVNVTTTAGSPGDDPHHVLRYLADPVTARVVLGAWCDAFRVIPAGVAPAGCDSVVRSGTTH